jgi:DNA mismatch repair ATPase MutS
VERHPRQIVYLVMAASMVLALVLSFKWPGLLLVAMFGAVVNLMVRGLTAVRVIRVAGPFRQISALIGVAESLLFLAETEHTPIVGALRRDVTSLQRLKRIVRSVGLDPLGSGEITFALFEYVNLLFLLDVNAVYLGAGELRAQGPALLRLIAAVGDVDAAISVASLRAEHHNWTRPTFLPPGARTALIELRHPLLEESVPNSLELDLPGGALITGANMSGKTTFIRAVGVNVVLAQSINTCFAACYEAPVLRVRSCIGRSDDLLSGKSYYAAEVDAVLAHVAASESPISTLFLFDELFRGTNAVERIAAAEAVLRELIGDGNAARPHVVLAATHDHELVGYLHGTYQAFHFADRVTPDGLAFDYRIRPGASPTRNAIALLDLRGAPSSVVTRATTRAARLDALRTGAGKS